MTTDQVEKYAEQMVVVLGVLGDPGALVSDLSDVGDFINDLDPEVERNKLIELSDIFGIPVSFRTPLWKLAEAITIKDICGQEQD